MIDHLTMQPPSAMVRDFVVLMASGSMNHAMLKTFANVGGDIDGDEETHGKNGIRFR